MKVKASFRSLNPPKNLTRAPRDDRRTLTWGLGPEILCYFFLRWIREGESAAPPTFFYLFLSFKKTPFSRFKTNFGTTNCLLHSIQKHKFSKGNFNENSIANSNSKFDEKSLWKNHEISSRISMEILDEKIFWNFYEKSIALSWNFKIFATFASNLKKTLSSENLLEPCHSHEFPAPLLHFLIKFWSDFGIQPATKCVTPALCWFMSHFWNQKFAIYFSCIFLAFFGGWWNAFMRH